MSAAHPIDPHLISAHTTAAPSSVAHWVSLHYGLAVQQCHLIRRGLNDNYLVRLADGTRCVARLYSLRPRGGFNIDFECALLAHLDAQGAGVAVPRLAADGRAHVHLQFPEGARALALFAHAEGAVPDTLADFELTGSGLARIHEAARTYAGPPSIYTLDGPYLAGRTLEYLRAHPSVDEALVQALQVRAQRLLDELAAAGPGLTRVLCHGDTHGFNNHVYRDASGAPKALFFDFDDAGPGFLAYDLAVLPWSHLFRKGLNEPDDALRERWTLYLGAYRMAGGQVSGHDLQALPMFLQLRHLWNMGEAFGRLHHWGINVFSIEWLRKQPDVMDAWGRIDLSV